MAGKGSVKTTGIYASRAMLTSTVWARRNGGYNITQIARQTGVSHRTVRRILESREWYHQHIASPMRKKGDAHTAVEPQSPKGSWWVAIFLIAVAGLIAYAAYSADSETVEVTSVELTVPNE